VVAELDGDFAPHLVEVLQSFRGLERTTAAVAVGATVARTGPSPRVFVQIMHFWHGSSPII
jgi:hypothetical protein